MSAMHLSPEELQSFVDGSSDSDTETKISNHVRECGECAEALSAAARFEEKLHEAVSAQSQHARATTTVESSAQSEHAQVRSSASTAASDSRAPSQHARVRSSAGTAGSDLPTPAPGATGKRGASSFRRAARVLIPLAMAASLLYVLTLRSKPIDVVTPPEESAAIPAVICPDGPDQSACIRSAHARGLIVGYPISAGAPDIGAAPLKASEWSFE